MLRHPVTRVGARLVKTRCVYNDWHIGHVDSPSHSKNVFCKVISAEAEVPWQIMKRAMAKAGNRAGKTVRRVQWRDSGLECAVLARL